MVQYMGSQRIGHRGWTTTMLHLFISTPVLLLHHIHPTFQVPKFLAITVFFYYHDSFLFPECHMIETIELVVFSDWLLYLSNIYWWFFYGFCGLNIDLSFLLLNNILLHGFTIVYLSIHLLKDILFASRFWELLIKVVVAQWCPTLWPYGL